MEAAVFAEGRNIDQLLEMLAGLDPTRDSVTENDVIQVLFQFKFIRCMKFIEPVNYLF
jgi:hypothetical protein